MTGPSRRTVTIAGLGLAAAAFAAGAPARADDLPESGSTWAWLVGQLGSGVPVTTASEVSPDRSYPPEWTAAVAGSVRLVGLELPPQRLQVEHAVVTDRVYRLAQVPVSDDGSFAFDWSRPGLKLFWLRDTVTGDVLAEHAPDTGLLRSFDVPDAHRLADRSFSYDQALGLLTALSLGDRGMAAVLAGGLLRLQTAAGRHDGGFVTSAAALYPEGALAEYRTGNHAIAVYALLRYLRDGGLAGAERDGIADAAARGVAWLRAQQDAAGPLTGLVRGGHGAFINGEFDAGHQLPWASTEHNLDAWHTLRLAAALGDVAASEAADRLEVAIDALLWSAQEQRFWQGRSPEGPDTAHALDVNSWGAVQLAARQRPDQARRALANLAWFATTDAGVSGYAPVPFPSPPLVWVEGTGGVALAQLRVGRPDEARATMRAVAPIATDGVYPACTRDDPVLSMTSAPAVAAAAWVLLVEQALAGRPSIWDDESREMS